MIRNIYKQLWNRRRSNGWLLIELFLVFCLVWYMVDYFFELGFNTTLKNNQQLSYTWQIELGEYPQDHPAFAQEGEDPEVRYGNFIYLMDLLKNQPLIEAVGISFHSVPGKNSGMFKDNRSQDSTKIANGKHVVFDPHYEYFGVFKNTRENGQILAKVTDFDWGVPGAVAVSKKVAETLYPGESAMGKVVLTQDGKRVKEMRIVGVIDDTKRFEHQRYEGVYYTPQQLDLRNFKWAEIVIRSKDHVYPGTFKSTFMKEIAPSLRKGNYYLKELTYIPGIESDSNRGRDSELLTQFCMVLFLLVNVVLCLIGTFWYRVNTRKAEIGLRLAVGSTRKGVVWLLCIEAVALLTCIVIPAMLLEYQLMELELTQMYYLKFREPQYLIDNVTIRFLITNVITFLLLLIVVSFSVWVPARKAAVMAPAEVLHED